MVAEAFVPSVNQSIETGIEEIKVQVPEPLKEGFLNFVIGSEMAICQVVLQRSEEMKITWCEIRVVGRVFQSIPSEMLFQMHAIEAVCDKALSCNNRTPFETSPGRSL
ncbi:hypothetical protein AVEN_64086-1 [Araneus ventricosus]|uniref:Uncharacterized protein n=1 Tax=Araneus ventricosus TaxID=182803 RepID=A0A4Y2K127_ARAVE|nr:hypothetical protein AVEN_64086-1 [Araneus ventricosus]